MKISNTLGKPTLLISTDFSFFLVCKILNTTFLLESLMMTFFALAFGLELAGFTGVSYSLKIFKTQSSKSSLRNSWNSHAL